MKHILIIFSLLLLSSPLFAQSECDETTRARMIKSGISDKTIEEQCGKIGEKEKASENIENENTKEIQSFRLAIGGAYGKFKYSDSYNTELSGIFDHDLGGGGLGISYIMFNEKKLFYGGGLSLVSVNGPRNVSSKHKKPGSYTYYSSTYGYFDIYISVKHFASSFFYGLVGLNLEISDGIAFQPNMRIGLKSLEVSWEEYIDFRSYTNVRTSYREDSSKIGLEIDLPIMFKYSESFRYGFNLCLCRSNLEVSDGTGEYDFTSVNILNLSFDFKL